MTELLEETRRYWRRGKHDAESQTADPSWALEEKKEERKM